MRIAFHAIPCPSFQVKPSTLSPKGSPTNSSDDVDDIPTIEMMNDSMRFPADGTVVFDTEEPSGPLPVIPSMEEAVMATSEVTAGGKLRPSSTQ